jgi:hypothetical protein
MVMPLRQPSRPFRVASALALIVLALLVSSACSATSADASGKPALDVRDGTMFGVSLGERATRVRRKLGHPDDVRRVPALGVHWFYARIDLQMFLDPRTKRVQDLFTANEDAKTASKIGVGSNERQILRAYPQAVCASFKGARNCTIAGTASLTRLDLRSGHVTDVEMLPLSGLPT